MDQAIAKAQERGPSQRCSSRRPANPTNGLVDIGSTNGPWPRASATPTVNMHGVIVRQHNPRSPVSETPNTHGADLVVTS